MKLLSVFRQKFGGKTKIYNLDIFYPLDIELILKRYSF